MYLSILKDDGSSNRYDICREQYEIKALKDHIGYIHSDSKEFNALEIFKAFYSDSKAIMLDASNKRLFAKLKDLQIKDFSDPTQSQTLFDKEDFLMIFFTSGSTGNPVGALKTKQNLEEEVKALTKLLQKYQIKKVIVTVPFTHIYGTLLGLLYPLINELDIVFKEHFLPHDLLETIEDHCLVVTTPLYIKALTKINQTKELHSSVFISSTAPLDQKVAEHFISKFNTDLIQLFGSTETGGIAYKKNYDELWTPLDNVVIATNKENELIVKSPFISAVLYENGLHYTEGKIQTFDYVELERSQFKLLGRSSKILKIAGKRYSTIQIENCLEEIEGISKALVFVETDQGSLRGELLNITLESNQKFSIKEIKKIIQNSFSNLKFSIKLKIVDIIPTTEVGKKLLIK